MTPTPEEVAKVLVADVTKHWIQPHNLLNTFAFEIEKAVAQAILTERTRYEELKEELAELYAIREADLIAYKAVCDDLSTAREEIERLRNAVSVEEVGESGLVISLRSERDRLKALLAEAEKALVEIAEGRTSCLAHNIPLLSCWNVAKDAEITQLRWEVKTSLDNYAFMRDECLKPLEAENAALKAELKVARGE